MKMSNKVYDILKYITQIIIPAVATLYFAELECLVCLISEGIAGDRCPLCCFDDDKSNTGDNDHQQFLR